MHALKLLDYVGEYVGLRLSCGSTLCGKLRKERMLEGKRELNLFFLDNALLRSNDSIENTLAGYFLQLEEKESIEESLLRTYAIAPEHVTVIRPVTDEVVVKLEETET